MNDESKSQPCPQRVEDERRVYGVTIEHVVPRQTQRRGGSQGGRISLQPAARNPTQAVALASSMAALIFSSMVRVVSVLQLCEQSVMRQTTLQSSLVWQLKSVPPDLSAAKRSALAARVFSAQNIESTSAPGASLNLASLNVLSAPASVAPCDPASSDVVKPPHDAIQGSTAKTASRVRTMGGRLPPPSRDGRLVAPRVVNLRGLLTGDVGANATKRRTVDEDGCFS